MKAMESKVYTVNEIIAILAISKNAAYKFIRENPPFKVLKIGDTYRIPKDGFDRWFEQIQSVDN